MTQAPTRPLRIFVWLFSIGVAFWGGQWYSSYTSWRPITSLQWEKKVVTREGILTLQIEDRGPDRLWTIRGSCKSAAREWVVDYIVDAPVAGLRTCGGNNFEVLPSPVWQKLFKDAPAKVPEETIPQELSPEISETHQV